MAQQLLNENFYTRLQLSFSWVVPLGQKSNH